MNNNQNKSEQHPLYYTSEAIDIGLAKHTLKDATVDLVLIVIGLACWAAIFGTVAYIGLLQ